MTVPGPDASPGEVVNALRARALSFMVIADSFDGKDKGAAAVVREEAMQLRCQAAVIEAMSALHDELGWRAQLWGEIANRLRNLT